ncbi:MAG: serine kinase [Pseudomonadota bacterium]
MIQLADIAQPDPAGGMAVHGSAVVFEGSGVLFFGPSGSGKSQSALSLLALGAQLISDDRVIVSPLGLRAPTGALAKIEARGVGLLAADLNPGPVPFKLAIDLARSEPDRLPASRVIDCDGLEVPLILAAGHPNLAAVVVQFLRGGRAK